jgi:hypothetical protein
MFEMDGKVLSAAIRKRKKDSLRPDMDDAGQEAVDPNVAWDEKQATEVNEALGEPDHEPASASEMGEDEGSQDKAQLKRAVARINKYFDMMDLD